MAQSASTPYQTEGALTPGGTASALSPGDPFSDWLVHFGLSKLAASLQEAGLEEYAMIANLDDEDLNEIMEDAQLKKLQKKHLKKAVQAVKDGTYPTEAVNPELARLRDGRSDWKGDIERKEDPELECVHDGKKTRTIILIGQTGAGKTTLINSMCNYLHSVAYDEPFRYKLIMERKNKDINEDETKSQTRDITKYHLRDLPAIDYALNIIDTPGFGDTDGPMQDRLIRGKFKDFFESIESIDAIYFVIKHSDTRLGAIQKYIFDMVLNLFGKDMKDNIFLLFTFSDGAEPPALKQVNAVNVPYSAYFQINNSGFGLSDPDKSNETHRMFFDLGMKQFGIVFDALDKVETKSTELSRQTVTERENITTWLFQIRQDIKTAMDYINEMHKTHEYLKANETKIDANKDFLVPVTKTVLVEEKLSHKKATTYCTKCRWTCHDCCAIPEKSKKNKCSAMKAGVCMLCPGKCDWNEHQNYQFVVRREVKTEFVTQEAAFKEYNLASDAAAKCKDMMQRLMNMINAQEEKIRTTIIKMKESINRLPQIALNNNILTDEQYFDTLIHSEETEAKPGWERRVEQFKNMKKENKLLRDVTQDKEPISWHENPELLKYKEEFAAKPEQEEVEEEKEQKVTTTETTIEVKVGLFGVSAKQTTKTTETTVPSPDNEEKEQQEQPQKKEQQKQKQQQKKQRKKSHKKRNKRKQ